MEPADWKPVYMTDEERADIAARLIMHGEDSPDPRERTRCLWLASILVFATTPEVRA
jgi:hypothetical protein